MSYNKKIQTISVKLFGLIKNFKHKNLMLEMTCSCENHAHIFLIAKVNT